MLLQMSIEDENLLQLNQILPEDVLMFSTQEKDMIDVSQISPRSSTMHDIQQYNTNLNNLYAGNVFQPASPEQIIDVRQCCYRSCTYYLSRIVIETLRLVIPLDSKAMRDFHFNKMKEMYDGSQFVYVIDGEAVCENMFAAIFIISNKKLQNIKKEIMDGHTQAKIHGNDSISLKSKKYYKTMAELAVTLEDLTQDNPTKEGYMLPPGLTKKDLMKIVSPDKMLKPSYYLKGIKPTLHWRATNALTKCKYCCVFRCMLHQKVVDKTEIRKHRTCHYDNIHAEQLDYELRKMYGIKFPRMLISFTHDGMAKNKLRLPHLNINRSKILSDVDLAYCNLNSLLIHRKNEEGGNCIIDGYFNLGESFPGGANSVISQIITSLTQCTPIPPILTIQLDNCSSNKCYAVIGAFAWLLQHQTAVKEVYLCYNEVGHTHIDVDGFFGRFATLLDRTECFSPQDMFGLLLRQKGVRQAAYCLKIYDFTAMLLPHLNKFGNLKNNHMFRVYLTADKIPKVQIAPFIRSSKWLKGVPDAEIYDTDVFTTQPELDKMPEPMKCDYGKLESLLHVASKAKELLTKNQLQNYHHIVNLLKNSVAKPFVEIIETLNANGIATHQDVASSGLQDPHNVEIEKFFKQNKEIVNKIWNEAQQQQIQPEDECEIPNENNLQLSLPEEPLQTPNDVAPIPENSQQLIGARGTRKPKAKRKNLDIEVPPSDEMPGESDTAAPQKRPRGRPKKIQPTASLPCSSKKNRRI